jgi:hypothetical protein
LIILFAERKLIHSCISFNKVLQETSVGTS